MVYLVQWRMVMNVSEVHYVALLGERRQKFGNTSDDLFKGVCVCVCVHCRGRLLLVTQPTFPYGASSDLIDRS